VDHQLEDGAPQRGVVEGSGAAASLQDRTQLQTSREKVKHQTAAFNLHETHSLHRTICQCLTRVNFK